MPATRLPGHCSAAPPAVEDRSGGGRELRAAASGVLRAVRGTVGQAVEQVARVAAAAADGDTGRHAIGAARLGNAARRSGRRPRIASASDAPVSTTANSSPPIR